MNSLIVKYAETVIVSVAAIDRGKRARFEYYFQDTRDERRVYLYPLSPLADRKDSGVV